MRAIPGIAALMMLLGLLWGQDTVFVCPMDPDVRSNTPGKCQRCGMELKSGIPDAVEYHMDLTATPRAPKVQEKTRLEFAIHDPWKDRPVLNFQIVHEKLFHLFVVSQDMEYFVHDHPIYGPNGTFYYDIAFPRPGMYRVLGDFYPDGATPQLIAKTVFVPGTPAEKQPSLTRDYGTKDAENMKVEFWSDPPQPIAGLKTLLYFKVSPVEGFEKLLGAWGHMLAASDDLIDMIHTHPFIADGGAQVQFNMTFPRPRPYRVWVQFQRNGVVNTAHFDIPVNELK